MLKINNNKRNFTIAVGILVAIVIILSSFGNSIAEGVLQPAVGWKINLSIDNFSVQKVIKVLYHLFL